MQAPGGDTLRRNFQQIQEGRTVEPPPRLVCFMTITHINLIIFYCYIALIIQ